MGMLSELHVFVTESLLTLANSLATPLAASGTSSIPALATMPLLHVVDGDSCYGSLQSCLLTQGGLLLQCDRLYGSHHRLLGKLGSLPSTGGTGQPPSP